MNRKKRVLIVDDEPIVIQYLCYFLKDRYEPLSTSFGKAAIEYVKTDDIDLVILDYILPDSTGIDVLRMTGYTPSHYRTIIRSQDPKYMKKAI